MGMTSRVNRQKGENFELKPLGAELTSLMKQIWIPDRQDVWCLARLGRMTKEVATVTIPGIYDESFDVPREHTRAWDPSHSLYLEVCKVMCKCGFFLAGCCSWVVDFLP